MRGDERIDSKTDLRSGTSASARMDNILRDLNVIQWMMVCVIALNMVILFKLFC
jgi:hypothetical protein